MSSSTAARQGLAIRWRLTIWIAVAFALTLVAIFFSMRIAVSQILQDDVNRNLHSTYEDFRRLALVRGAGNAQLADLANNYEYPIVIRETTGEFVAANTAQYDQMVLSEEELAQIVSGGRTIDQTRELGGEQYRVRSGRVDFGDATRVLQVGRNSQVVADVTNTVTTILLGGGAVSLLIVLGVGYWLARSALRPVEQITQLAAEIEASDLTRRLAVENKPAEVQRLANTFDAMLARLESAFGQQRNFVMDVSHELRTPLTGLRGNIDVMLMAPDLDPETRSQLERMSAEVSRLIRLTSNLLYFAHAEAGRDIVRLPVELDELCLEVVYQSRDIRRDVNVRLTHEEQVSVAGDRDLLKQLVLNLVDNAIKFSPSGGEVLVSLHHNGDSAQVVVEDGGPGIERDQLELIFDRFHRAPSNDSHTGGAGIGLAISRWIARVHGGDLRAESEVGRGSRFIVTLPLASVDEPVSV